MQFPSKFTSHIALIVTFPLNVVQFQVNIGEICMIDFAEKHWYTLIEHSLTFTDILNAYNY